MLKRRLIPVLIVRDGRVVQSVRFQHPNVIHADPLHAMECFNKWAADEIALLDVSREEAGRPDFPAIVARVSEHCFVPLTVGGWVRDVPYARELLKAGADKIVVNSLLHDDPGRVRELAETFGRQCIVASIDVRRREDGSPTCRVDRGHRDTGVGPAQWARMAQEHGAGEIFLNSMDHDGARKGYDLESLRAVLAAVGVPVVIMGGVFTWDHLADGLRAGADAVAAANIFHYTEHSVRKAKQALLQAGLPVRAVPAFSVATRTKPH